MALCNIQISAEEVGIVFGYATAKLKQFKANDQEFNFDDVAQELYEYIYNETEDPKKAASYVQVLPYQLISAAMYDKSLLPPKFNIQDLFEITDKTDELDYVLKTYTTEEITDPEIIDTGIANWVVAESDETNKQPPSEKKSNKFAAAFRQLVKEIGQFSFKKPSILSSTGQQSLQDVNGKYLDIKDPDQEFEYGFLDVFKKALRSEQDPSKITIGGHKGFKIAAVRMSELYPDGMDNKNDVLSKRNRKLLDGKAWAWQSNVKITEAFVDNFEKRAVEEYGNTDQVKRKVKTLRGKVGTTEKSLWAPTSKKDGFTLYKNGTQLVITDNNNNILFFDENYNVVKDSSQGSPIYYNQSKVVQKGTGYATSFAKAIQSPEEIAKSKNLKEWPKLSNKAKEGLIEAIAVEQQKELEIMYLIQKRLETDPGSVIEMNIISSNTGITPFDLDMPQDKRPVMSEVNWAQSDIDPRTAIKVADNDVSSWEVKGGIYLRLPGFNISAPLQQRNWTQEEAEYLADIITTDAKISGQKMNNTQRVALFRSLVYTGKDSVTVSVKDKTGEIAIKVKKGKDVIISENNQEKIRKQIINVLTEPYKPGSIYNTKAGQVNIKLKPNSGIVYALNVEKSKPGSLQFDQVDYYDYIMQNSTAPLKLNAERAIVGLNGYFSFSIPEHTLTDLYDNAPANLKLFGDPKRARESQKESWWTKAQKYATRPSQFVTSISKNRTKEEVADIIRMVREKEVDDTFKNYAGGDAVLDQDGFTVNIENKSELLDKIINMFGEVPTGIIASNTGVWVEFGSNVMEGLELTKSQPTYKNYKVGNFTAIEFLKDPNYFDSEEERIYINLSEILDAPNEPVVEGQPQADTRIESKKFDGDLVSELKKLGESGLDESSDISDIINSVESKESKLGLEVVSGELLDPNNSITSNSDIHVIHYDGQILGALIIARKELKLYPAGSVSNVLIHPGLRGKGIATELYRKINSDRISKGLSPLKSDSDQTPASQALWKRLVKSGEAKIIGKSTLPGKEGNPIYQMIGQPQATGYSALTKAELKAELSKRGLKVSGNKADLVARLELDDSKTGPESGVVEGQGGTKVNPGNTNEEQTSIQEEIDKTKRELEEAKKLREDLRKRKQQSSKEETTEEPITDEKIAEVIDDVIDEEDLKELKKEIEADQDLVEGTNEEIKQILFENVKDYIKRHGNTLPDFPGALAKAIKKVLKGIMALIIAGAVTVGTTSWSFNNDGSLSFSLENSVETLLPDTQAQWAKRYLDKKGLIDIKEAALIVEEQVAPVIEETPKVDRFFQLIGTVPDSYNPSDSLMSYRSQWDNAEGFRYIPAPVKKDLPGEGIKVNGVIGVGHFLLDASVAADKEYSHENNKVYLRKAKENNDYVPAFTRNPDGSVNLKYKRAKDLVDSDIVVSALRQMKFSDIEFSKTQTPKGFKSTIKEVVKKDGSGTYLIFKDRNGYSRFSGGSVVFIFNDVHGNTIIRDFAGTINNIEWEGLEIIKAYNLKPGDLTIGYHDVGSFSAKPKAKEGVIDSKQWAGFNPEGWTGGALIIPAEGNIVSETPLETPAETPGAPGALLMSLLPIVFRLRKKVESNEDITDEDLSELDEYIASLELKLDDLNNKLNGYTDPNNSSDINKKLPDEDDLDFNFDPEDDSIFKSKLKRIRWERLKPGYRKKRKNAMAWFKSSPISKTSPLDFDNLFSIVNSNAFASWSKNGIKLYKGADETDLYHEAYHGFTQLYLTQDEKVQMYEELLSTALGPKILEEYAKANNKDINALKNYDRWRAADEYLAEDYRTYMLSDGKKVLTNRPQTASIFRRILNFLKWLFTGVNPNDIVIDPVVVRNVGILYNNMRVLRDEDLVIYSPSELNVMPGWGQLNKGIEPLQDGGPTINDADALQISQSIDSIISTVLNEQISLARASKEENKRKVAQMLVGALYTAPDKILPKMYLNVYKTLKDKRKELKEQLDDTADIKQRNKIQHQIKLHDYAIEQFGDVEQILDVITGKSTKGTVAYHLQNSEYIKPAFELSRDELSDFVNTDTPLFSIDTSTISQKDLASAEIKSIIYSAHMRDDKGEFVENIMGYPKLVDPGKAWRTVVSAVKDQSSRRGMRNALLELSKTSPKNKWIEEDLLHKLGPLDVKNPLSHSLWVKFWQSMFMAEKPLYTTTIERVFEPVYKLVDGVRKKTKQKRTTYRVLFGQSQAQFRAAERDFTDHFKTVRNHPFIKLTDNNENVLDVQGIVDKYKNSNFSETGILFLRDLGIPVSNNTKSQQIILDSARLDMLYKKLKDYNDKTKKNKKIKPINDIIAFFRSSDNKLPSESKNLNTIFDAEAKYSGNYSTTALRNAKGDTQYADSRHSSLTRMALYMNESESFHELVAMRQMAHLNPENNPFTKQQINGMHNDSATMAFLNSIYDFSKPDIPKRKGVKINVTSLAGITNLKENGYIDYDYSEKTSNLDSFGRQMNDIYGVLLAGMGQNPTPADKGTIVAVTVTDESGTTKIVTDDIAKFHSHLYIDTVDFLVQETETKTNGEQNFINQMIPFIQMELDVIKAAKENTNNESIIGYTEDKVDKDGNVIEEAAAKDFALFDDIFSDTLKAKLKKATSVQELYDTDLEVSREIDAFLLNYLNSELETLKQRMDGMIYFDSNLMNDHINSAADSKSIELSKVSRPQRADALLKSYLANSTIHRIQVDTIFYGFASQYKDFFKRNPGVNSDGKQLLTDEDAIDYVNERYFGKDAVPTYQNINFPDLKAIPFDGTLRTAVMRETEVTSVYVDRIQEDLEKYYENIFRKRGKKNKKEAAKLAKVAAEEAVKPYRNMEEGDGQGWITIDWYKILSELEGSWTPEQDKLYNAIIKGETIYANQYVQFFPSKKFQYWGPLAKMMGLPAHAFHKYSVAPLVPNVIENTNAEILHNNMVKQQIAIALHLSGSKISTVVDKNTKKASILYNEEDFGKGVRTIDEAPILDLNDPATEYYKANTIHLEYLKNQLDVASKFKRKNTMSSQMRKLVEKGYMEAGVPVDFMPDVDPAKRKTEWDKLEEVEKLAKSQAYTEIIQYENNIQELIDRKKKVLVKSTGWTEEDIKNGTREINKIKSLVDLLKRELKNAGLPTTDLDMIDVNSKGDGLLYDISISPVTPVIEKSLTALINNTLVRQRPNGEMLIQLATTLFEPSKPTDEQKAKHGTNDLEYYQAAREFEGTITTQGDLEKTADVIVRSIDGDHKYIYVKDPRTGEHKHINKDDITLDTKDGERVKGKMYKDSIMIYGEYYAHNTIIDGTGEQADIILVDSMEDAKLQAKAYTERKKTNFTRYEVANNERTIGADAKIAMQGDYYNLLYLTHMDGDPVYVKDEDGNILEKESLVRLNELINDPEWRSLKENLMLITLVGVRIPVQEDNSMEFFHVKQFLPHSEGNILIAPSELVAKSGGDFDIDKLTLLMANISLMHGKPTMVLNSKSVRDEYEIKDDIKSVKKKVKKTHQKFGNRIAKVYKAIGNSTIQPLRDKRDEMSDKVDMYEEGFKQGLVPIDPIKLDQLREEITTLSSQIEFLEKEIKNSDEVKNNPEYQKIIEKRDKALEPLNNKLRKLELELKGKSVKAIENELMIGLWTMLSNPLKYHTLLTPNNADPMKMLAAEMREKKEDRPGAYNSMLSYQRNENGKRKKLSKPSRSSTISPTYNMHIHDVNSEGKAVLGIGAVENAFNTILDRVGAHLNPIYNVSLEAYEIAKEEMQTGKIQAQIDDLENQYPDPESRSKLVKDKLDNLAFMLELYEGDINKAREINIFLPHNTLKYKEYDVVSLSHLYDAFGEESIGRNLSMLIDGWVDVSKDWWIFDVNGNKVIAPTLLFLIEMGVPVKLAVDFVSNPLVEEYRQRLRKAQSALSKANNKNRLKTDKSKEIDYMNLRTQIRKEMLLDYNVINSTQAVKNRDMSIIHDMNNRLKKKLKGKSIDAKTLDKVVKTDPTSSNAAMMDARDLFLHYLEIEEIGQDYKKLKTTLNYDTTKSVTLYEAAKRIEKQEDLYTNTVFPSYIIDAILNESPIGSFDIQRFQLDLWKNVFPLRTSEKILKYILGITGNIKNLSKIKSEFGTEERFANKFLNDLVVYALQKDVLDTDIKEGYKGYEVNISSNLLKDARTNRGVIVNPDSGEILIDKDVLKKQFQSLAFAQSIDQQPLNVLLSRIENFTDKTKKIKLDKDKTAVAEKILEDINYQTLQLAELDSNTFKRNTRGYNQFVKFTIERELLRLNNPLAEFIKTNEFTKRYDRIKDIDSRTDESIDAKKKRQVRQVYEEWLKDTALYNILNMHQLFNSDNSVMHRVKEIINNHPNLLDTYAILESIQYESDSKNNVKYHNIKFRNTKLENNEIDAAITEFRELADPNVMKVLDDSPQGIQENREISKFFEMLPIYAFLQSGMNIDNRFALGRVMPKENLLPFLKKSTDKLAKEIDSPIGLAVLMDFQNQFRQHNKINNANFRNRNLDFITDDVRDWQSIIDQDQFKYEGGYSNKWSDADINVKAADTGKGTKWGDEKDQAMRLKSDAAIVELNVLNRNSSSKTSLEQTGDEKDTIKNKNGVYTGVSFERINGQKSFGDIVMLARNGKLKNTPLSEETRSQIAEANESGARFVVGDMPGVDTQFIEYLLEIGAGFEVFHTGEESRIDVDSLKVDTLFTALEDSYDAEILNMSDTTNLKQIIENNPSKVFVLPGTITGLAMDQNGNTIEGVNNVHVLPVYNAKGDLLIGQQDVIKDVISKSITELIKINDKQPIVFLSVGYAMDHLNASRINDSGQFLVSNLFDELSTQLFDSFIYVNPNSQYISLSDLIEVYQDFSDKQWAVNMENEIDSVLEQIDKC